MALRRSGTAAAAVLALTCLFAGPMVGHAAAQAVSQASPRLSAGDVVRFDILDDDKDPTSLTVGTDGTIQAPYIGSVAIAGMSVAQALKALDDSYRSRKIFMNPNIGLSVESYQPIFVLGDVRQPGSYPYRARLTVQKAVALAGGHIADPTLQDPTLAQARIRGEIETTDTEIIRDAVTIARLSAALDDRDSIRDSDLPSTAVPYLAATETNALRAVATRLLKTDNAGITAQITEIKEQIASADAGVELLQQLLARVSKSADLTRGDLDRSKTLNQRGLNTLSQLSDIQRELNTEEGRELEVLSRLADAKRQIGALKSQVLDLKRTHRLGLLTSLQESSSALAKAVASRQSSERQFVLVSGLQSTQQAFRANLTLDYRIRGDGAASERTVAETTALQPGDVLIVTMRPDDKHPAAAISQTGALPQSQALVRRSSLGAAAAGNSATE